MCGITGIIRLNGSSVNIIHPIVKMNTTLRHRGPDGEGFLTIDNEYNVNPCYGKDTPDSIIHSDVLHHPLHSIDTANENAIAVLGHRRLSIIDLSAGGHQPLCSSDGTSWITYNGEVYNFPEIRNELQTCGYLFKTHTDSEVVLAAYDKWGAECLQKFNGMFAFVIWDSKKKILFGARDRTGVKPFYYYQDRSIFTFASEQKALLKNELVKTSINPKAVADYFVAGEIEYQEESFCKNILELFPGHAFELDIRSGEFRKWQWYDPELKEELPNFSERQYSKFIDEAQQKIVQAIRLRLRSDVPVGACLSGGIDSSSIAGVIGKIIGDHEKVNVGDHLKLFTCVFDEKQIDERKWAAEMVERTKAEWHQVNPKPEELMQDLEELIYCQDVPIWSTSTYAQFRTMKLVKENGIKVVLDGQGGDELFAGYLPYYIPFWRELRALNKRTMVLNEMNAYGTDAKAYKKREYLKQRVVPSLPVRQQLMIQRNYFPDIRYLDKDLIQTYVTNYQKKKLPDTLNESLKSEFFNTRLKGYLKCEDRCSMWHSVESRTPFSEDHELFEAIFKMPGSMKIRNGHSKFILREAMKPFVSEKILARKDKLGYATPNNKWITQLRDQFRPYFEVDLNGFVRKDKLLTDYDKFFSVEDRPENGRVFKFVAFAVWRKVNAI